MGTNVKITYVDRSMDQELPKIFLFFKDKVPTFDALRDGVAWRVIEDVGRGSSCGLDYPTETKVSASWDGHTCQTAMVSAAIGKRCCVVEDDTGITITEDGSAGSTRSIDVASKIHVANGISAGLYKGGKLMMREKAVAYGRKATFILHPKLYWGLASEIQEGDRLSSAVLDSDSFFEQDLEGASRVTVGLYGNAQDGYRFAIEGQE